MVSINGSWGYIPLEQGSVRYLGNDSDVLVKMANGSADKGLAVKEFSSATVSGLMPAVLSSHLENGRRRKESEYAAHVRARDGDPNEQIRVVVERLRNSKLVLKRRRR